MRMHSARLLPALTLLAVLGPVSAQAPKERLTMTGLKHCVEELAVSPDGKLVAASASHGGVGELKLWNVATGKEVDGFKGGDQTVTGLAFLPDDKTLVSCGLIRANPLIQLHDLTGKGATTAAELDEVLLELAISADGKFVALGCSDNQVRVWDFGAKKLKHTLKGTHANIVQAVAYSPDGKTIASGCCESIICLWDADTGREKAVLKGHKQQIRKLAFSPNGKTLASASWDKTVRLWNPADGTVKATLEHPAAVVGLAISPDGNTLAGAAYSKPTVLWDVASGKEKVRVEVKDGSARVAFTPDGKTLVVGTTEGAVVLFDLPAK